MTTIKEFLSKHISNRFGEEFSKLFANANDDIHDDYSDYVCFIKTNITVTYSTYLLKTICADATGFNEYQYKNWLEINEKHDSYKVRVEYIAECVESDTENDFDGQYVAQCDKNGCIPSDYEFVDEKPDQIYWSYEKGNDDLMIKEIISELKKSDLSYLK